MDAKVRWMIRSDLSEVLVIDRLCFPNPWCEEDFLAALRQRNCIGMVAEHEGMIVGSTMYELHKSHLLILNFAVHPEWQRSGVGTAMANRLKNKLSQQRRKRLMLNVREGNLDAQLFWRAQGFEAVEVIRGHYNNGEDAYAMQFTLDVEAVV